jgi:hypothetical protein
VEGFDNTELQEKRACLKKEQKKIKRNPKEPTKKAQKKTANPERRVKRKKMVRFKKVFFSF